MAHYPILYQDNMLLAVNKPTGVPVHQSRILEDDPETLLNAVRKQTGQLLYLVHRVDRPVSGVLLLCKDRSALAALGHSFEHRRAKKCYLAVVRGWADESGHIDHALNPPRDERNSRSVRREAVTRYELIARQEIPVPLGPYSSSRYSLLALYPETGRRHQLRRHAKHINHPIIGDTSYGRGEHNRLFREHYDCSRILLHAWSLAIEHPADGRYIGIQAPLDNEFRTIIDAMDWTESLETWQAASTAFTSKATTTSLPPASGSTPS